MAINNEIELDLSISNTTNVRCVQGDYNSRHIIVTITNCGIKYEIPDSATIGFRLRKPDHTCIEWTNKSSTNVNIVSDNRVRITLDDNCTAVPGVADAELQLIDSRGEIISTMNFYIVIQKSVLSDEIFESSNDVRTLNQLIKDVQEIQDRYNNEGAASEVKTHNESTTAHPDIRELINGKLSSTDVIDTWGTYSTTKPASANRVDRLTDNYSDILSDMYKTIMDVQFDEKTNSLVFYGKKPSFGNQKVIRIPIEMSGGDISEEMINEHNNSSGSHQDIRGLITTLATQMATNINSLVSNVTYANDTLTVTHKSGVPETYTIKGGSTPVKGVDYWTDEDKQELIDDIIQNFPSAEDLVF